MGHGHLESDVLDCFTEFLVHARPHLLADVAKLHRKTVFSFGCLPLFRSNGLPLFRSGRLPLCRPPWFPLLRSPGLPVFRSGCLPLCRPPWFPVFRSPGLPLFRSSRLPLCRPPWLPLFRFPWFPLCRPPWFPLFRFPWFPLFGSSGLLPRIEPLLHAVSNCLPLGTLFMNIRGAVCFLRYLANCIRIELPIDTLLLINPSKPLCSPPCYLFRALLHPHLRIVSFFCFAS